MANGLLVLVERVLGRYEAAKLGFVREFFGPFEAGDFGAIGPHIGAVGVRADQFGFTMPQCGEVDVELAGHANEQDLAPGPRHADRCFEQ